jgi:shikimate kinase
MRAAGRRARWQRASRSTVQSAEVNHGRHPRRNILLTGFYGSGLSAVGLELSRRMRRPYIDLTAELRRRRSRMRVLLPASAADGHEAERSLLADLSYRQETIIEIGVEAVEHGNYYEELHDFSFIVFVDPPFSSLIATLRAGRRRSDVLDEYGEDGLEARLQALRPRFERCDFQLTGEYTAQRAAALIIHSFFT